MRVFTLLVSIALIESPSALAENWQTVTVEDRPITISASGVIAPSEGQRFGPPPSQSWRIAITKLAREGTRVNAGDVLAEFDGSASDDRIKAKEAELNTRRSELASLLEAQAREIEEDKVRLADAKSEAEKAARKAAVDPSVYAGLEYRKLIEERVIAEDTYQREQERAVLVAKVRDLTRLEMEADVQRLESELRAAQAELQSFTITAPKDGLVVVGTNQQGQKLDVNDSVNPGMMVVELVDDAVLVVKADVPEFAAARIEVGQPVTISIEAAGGAEISGQIQSVSSIVRRQSRFSQAMVRGVTISFGDSEGLELRPGMSAKTSIVVATVPDVIALPEQAIRYREGLPGVIARGGWQPITLGASSGGLRIIESGLDAGTEVAL